MQLLFSFQYQILMLTELNVTLVENSALVSRGDGLHLLLLCVKSVIHKHSEHEMTSGNAVGNG